MLQKYQQSLELLLISCLFLLSNVSAFFYMLWLIPEIVFLELVGWLILATCSLWILNKRTLDASFVENLKRNWFIVPFIVFSGFSVFWSVYWQISLARWLILIFTVITSAYIGLRYTMKETFKLLSVFGVYILILSALLIFFVPDIGIMNYYSIQGAWRGLYWHKNHMGLISAFINILFLMNIIYSLQTKKKDGLLWLVVYLCSFLFVIQSDSVAAYVTIIFLHGVILLAFLWLKCREKIRSFHYLIFALFVIFASIFLYNNTDSVFRILNRSPTLTGRIPMWAYLFETYLVERPFFGYGFNAFWYIEPYRVDIGIAAQYPDPIVIADNGFIDILINTGYAGLFLFLIFFFGAGWLSIKYTLIAKNIIEIFPIILIFYLIVANMSWSLIFENESFFMLILISVLFSMSAKISLKDEN